MMLSLILLALAAPAAVPATQPVAAQRTDVRAEIAAELATMADNLARQDLDAFMRAYVAGQEPVYINGGRILRGHAAIRKDMEQFVLGPKQALSFTALDVTELADGKLLAIARPRLTDAAGKVTFQAVSSLIFVREGAQWRILLDHTD